MPDPLPLLFLAPYRDGSGYGTAARRYLRALLAHPDRVRVSARHIPIGRGDVGLTPDLLAAEFTPLPEGGPGAVLQVLPPPLFEVGVAARTAATPTHVGLFFVETDPLPPDWAMAASLMTACVVPTRVHADWVRASPHFTGAVHTVPVPADHAAYRSGRPVPPPLVGAPPAFRFYSIGEWIPRKNWPGLLRAYFHAFAPADPVELVVKASGAAPGDVQAGVREVAEACGLRRHPPVRVVTGWLTDDELAALHEHCDVFVQASFNEGWSLPAYDALRAGRTPVVPAAGGFAEFVDDGNGFPVPAVREPCFMGGPVHPELFTGRQTWAGPDLCALSAAMRRAFDDPGAVAARRERRMAAAPHFESAAVGRRLLEVIDAARQHQRLADAP